MWAAGFQRDAQACQERHWWIHHKDIAVATNDQAMSMLEKAVRVCARAKKCSCFHCHCTFCTSYTAVLSTVRGVCGAPPGMGTGGC